ncbi:condensation domain-containing protein [Clostridium sp.]|uniref:condensation domain-containing protein n=1 Tax=Clostridium sp. TaxID=1506 RepID=UPI003D6CDD63
MERPITITVKKIIIFSEKENKVLLEFKKSISISMQTLLSVIFMNGIKKSGGLKKGDVYTVGTPVNLRDSKIVENIVGPMINTIPFIVSCKESIEDYRQTQESLNYSISNKFIPYAKVVEANDGMELFQIVITAFQEYEIPKGMKIEENIVLYPENFGCTIHIYERDIDTKIVITSNYFSLDDLNLLEIEAKKMIINLEECVI